MSAADDEQQQHEEQQYLNTIAACIQRGQDRDDRTGTGALSLFAPPAMRFSLADGVIPVLTTKRVFWRGLAEELIWFIRGETNSNILKEKNVHIWDGNGSKEFLQSRGLGHREEGDLGPVYGFQWRHFGAAYKDCHTDYTGQGVDQLKEVIRKIKENPTDRRIIMSAWNPADLDKMALPPCHMFCQFYVTLPTADSPKPKLSCLMYQRSADLGLGVPFNIASYALLTHILAQVTDTEPHEFILQIGDAHVYRNHVEPLKIQLQRQPKAFPKLAWKSRKTDIDQIAAEDFELVGYQCHPKIEMAMSV